MKDRCGSWRQVQPRRPTASLQAVHHTTHDRKIRCSCHPTIGRRHRAGLHENQASSGRLGNLPGLPPVIVLRCCMEDVRLPQRRAALRDSGGEPFACWWRRMCARGIDVANMDMWINYDVPNCPEDYVHRIGRTGMRTTGRADVCHGGRSKTNCGPSERLLGQAVPAQKEAHQRRVHRDQGTFTPK